MNRTLLLSTLFLLPVVIMLFIGLYLSLEVIEKREKHKDKCVNVNPINSYKNNKEGTVINPVKKDSTPTNKLIVDKYKIERLQLRLLKLKWDKPIIMHVRRENDEISDYLSKGNIWGVKEVNWIIGKLKKSDNKNFLDVGCNLGTYSLLVSSEGYLSTCVEGLAENLEIVDMNIKINQLENKIKVSPYFVSSAEMECFYRSNSSNKAMGELICPDKYKMQTPFGQKVYTKKMDDIFENETKPFGVVKIKIGREGFNALKGFHKYLKKNCVEYILFETDNDIKTEGHYEFYKKLNYSIYNFIDMELVNKKQFYSFMGVHTFVAIKECKSK